MHRHCIGENRNNIGTLIKECFIRIFGHDAFIGIETNVVYIFGNQFGFRLKIFRLIIQSGKTEDLCCILQGINIM